MSKFVDVEDVKFTFPEDWEVEDFDSWYGSGKNAKPLTDAPFHAKDCDLLALSNGNLWLIEVKDYTYEGKRIPRDLATTFALKVFHTLGRLTVNAHFGNHEKKDFCKRAINAQEIQVALAIEARGTDQNLMITLAALKDQLERRCSAMKLKRVAISNSRVALTPVLWKQERIPESRQAHTDR